MIFFASGTTYVAALTIDGNTTVGNATSDTLTVTARLAADLDPNANNTIDLGTFGLAYNNIYVSSTAHLSYVSSTAMNVSGSLSARTNNGADLGAFDLAFNDIFASGTLYVGTLSQWDTSLSIGANFTAGDATSTDIVYLNARIASRIEPTVNNSEDIGAFDLAWNDIFASGTTYVAALTIDGNTTVGNATSDTLTVTARLAADLNPNANNTIDLGTFGLAYNNIYVSSTAHLNYVSSTAMNVSGSLSSLTNNGADLGEFGLAWNDIFASGTTYVAGLTIDGNTTVGNATSDTITINARLAADLDPNANNTIDLGQFDLAYNNIFVSSTSYLGCVSSTMISPWANNTSDLGGYGNAWKNIYASSTVYLTSVSTTQGIEAAPDTDTNFKFGRAAIFVPTPVTDALAIAHVDNASVLNFALYQDAAGATAINAK